MQPIRLYTSSPASTKLADLALDLARPGWPIELRPLSALPAPRPARLLALRQEHGALVASLASTTAALAALASSPYPPDAGRASGLRADRDALESRLRAVARTLAAQEGGQANV